MQLTSFTAKKNINGKERDIELTSDLEVGKSGTLSLIIHDVTVDEAIHMIGLFNNIFKIGEASPSPTEQVVAAAKVKSELRVVPDEPQEEKPVAKAKKAPKKKPAPEPEPEPEEVEEVAEEETEEEPEPPKKAKGKVNGFPEEWKTEGSVRNLLESMYDAGFSERAALIAECERIAEEVPLLARMQGAVSKRIDSALKVMKLFPEDQ